MKKITSIILVILFVFQFTCCNYVKKPDIDRPDFNSGTLMENEYANKAQYITINQAGIKSILYYNISDKCFSGSLENTSKKNIKEISVHFNIVGSKNPIIFGPVSLDKSEIVKVTSENIISKELSWKANFVFGAKDKIKEKDSEASIWVDNRVIDGSMVNVNSALMKLYEEFEVKENKGVIYKSNIYAGRHQSYTLKKYGVIVKVYYSTNHSAIIGTIQNNNEEAIHRFYLRIIYNGSEESIAADISSVSPGEKKEFGFSSKSWEDFEIYRPKLYFYWFEGTDQPKSEVEIKDLY